MNIQNIDLNNNLVNLSNSILKKYGVATSHPTIPEIDRLLDKHDRVVFLLFDGLGSEIIREHGRPNGVFKTSKIFPITSTFPPTTVAATTAFLNGKYPSETGWIGWTQYFEERDQAVNVFNNFDPWNYRQIGGPNIMETLYPTRNIFSLIKAKQPMIYVDQVWPKFRQGGVRTLGTFFSWLKRRLLYKNGPMLIYGYWDQPDATIHKYGVNHSKTRRVVRRIENKIKSLTEKYPNTLFVILADHGLVDVTFLDIQEYPDFYDTLVRPFSLESRCAAFFVKDDQHKQFEELFKKYYGNHFILKTHNEVLREQLFGNTMSPEVEKFIGDYVAIATDKYAFTYTTKIFVKMKSHHAGMTKAEMNINLTIINP